MVLLGGCYGVARWLPGGVAMVLLGGCYGVARWLLWCCYGVARWLLWCCKRYIKGIYSQLLGGC